MGISTEERSTTETHKRYSANANTPLNLGGGLWQPRYYQANAINRVTQAIADGEQRILLTMATGTGKTAVAFEIA